MAVRSGEGCKRSAGLQMPLKRTDPKATISNPLVICARSAYQRGARRPSRPAQIYGQAGSRSNSAHNHAEAEGSNPSPPTKEGTVSGFQGRYLLLARQGQVCGRVWFCQAGTAACLPRCQWNTLRPKARVEARRDLQNADRRLRGCVNRGEEPFKPFFRGRQPRFLRGLPLSSSAAGRRYAG